MIKYLFIFISIFFFEKSFSTSYSSAGVTGNWATPATWTPVGTPGPTDTVTINAGHTVTMDGNPGTCRFLTLSGTARWTAARTTNVGVDGIVVTGTGNISGGAAGILTTTGNLDINADLTSASVTVTMQTTAGLSITGTGSLARLQVNTTVSNDGDLGVTTLLSGSSTLTNSSGSILSIGNSVTLTTLNASAVNNTVIYNSSGSQSVKAGTYHHFTVLLPGTSTLAGAIIVNGDMNIDEGTLATGIYSITGNASGTLTMGANTFLTLGSTVSSTAVNFPTAYTNGNISLNLTSTVTYQTNGAQTISCTPNYGNLTVSTNGSIANKTLSAATLTVLGNMVLTSGNLNFNVAGNTVDLAGSLSGTGRLTLTTGTFNIGGSNTNSGTFTCGTGLMNYNGAAQTVRGATYYDLTISGSGIKTVASTNLTINRNLLISAGTLDVSGSNFSINVKGDWTNNGTFTSQAGTVTFSGTGLQNINGSSVTSFYDLTISNTTASGVVLQSAQSLQDVLTLSANSKLTTTGQTFTFLSTATTTAQLAAVPTTASFIGDITMQRFIPGSVTGWALFSSPVGTHTISNWQDDFVTSGFPSSTYPSETFVSAYYYDESTLGDMNQGYTSPTDASTQMDTALGFMAWVGDGLTSTSDITADVTGTPNIGTVNMPLTYTDDPGQAATEDGWNFIGNPYPSPISWSLLLATAGTPANIEDAIYVWNTDLNSGAGTYAQYVAGVSTPATGAGGIGNTIPSGQGFFVHLTGSTTLTATESVKTSGNPTFLRTLNLDSLAENPQYFRVYLKHDASSLQDEMVIRAHPLATDSFDKHLDAYKMTDTIQTSISSFMHKVRFSINSVNADSTSIIPVLVKVSQAGNYTISSDQFIHMPDFSCVLLEDKWLDTLVDLRNTSYTFYAYDTTTQARFNIHFKSHGSVQSQNVSCYGLNNGEIAFETNTNEIYGYVITDSLNQIVVQDQNVSGNFSMQDLNPGIYFVETMVNGSECGNFYDTLIITQPIELIAGFLSNVDTAYLPLSDPIFFTNISNDSLSAWDFGDTINTSTDFHASNFYYQKGNYQVSLIVYSNCTSDTFIKTIVIIDPADTLSVDTSIVTFSQEGVQQALKMYANNNTVNLLLPVSASNYSFQVFDLQGRCVYGPASISGDAQTKRIPLHLNTGLYIATISNNSFNFSKKIFIGN